MKIYDELLAELKGAYIKAKKRRKYALMCKSLVVYHEASGEVSGLKAAIAMAQRYASAFKECVSGLPKGEAPALEGRKYNDSSSATKSV